MKKQIEFEIRQSLTDKDDPDCIFQLWLGNSFIAQINFDDEQFAYLVRANPTLENPFPSAWFKDMYECFDYAAKEYYKKYEVSK